MKSAVFSFLVLLLLPDTSFATGLVQAPVLVKGQSVYTIPADFDPPLVKREGMIELNETVKSLRFPYFIVLVRDLPGVGDEKVRAQALTDGLAADWTEAGGFDPSISQLIVLVYEPRHFDLLSGAKFKNELGFTGDAFAPYIDIFQRSVKGTPKDPKGGIEQMIKAMDAYLVDATDPEKIAARKKAAEEEKSAQELRRAHNLFMEQGGRLEGLLEQNEHLPSNVGHYRNLIKQARSVRETNDSVKLLAFTASLQSEVDLLDAYVTRHKSASDALSTQIARMRKRLSENDLPADTSVYSNELNRAISVKRASQTEAMKEAANFLKIFTDKLEVEMSKIKMDATNRFFLVTAAALLGVLILYFLGMWFWNRRKRFLALKQEWEAAAKSWDERLQNASARYVNFDTEHEQCLRLEKTTGATGELFKQVTSSIDDIFMRVQAMRKRLSTCHELVAKATFWNFDPLVEAISNMNKSFSFETDELNRDDLFGSQTKSITVNPSDFGGLQRQFGETLNGWQQLKDASEVLFTTVRESFSHAKLDELFALAKEKGIPDRWLRTHPLYGDDASDNKFWETLTELRNTDPIGFLARVKDLKKEEADLEKILHELISFVEDVQNYRLNESVPDMEAVCDPAEDPVITLQQARHEEDRFVAALATESYVSRVEAQAKVTVGLYQKCRKQIDAISQAKSEKASLFCRAEVRGLNALEALHEADARMKSAEKIHGDVKSAEDAYASAAEFFKEADRTLEKAKRQEAENRFLNANATATKAWEAFAEAVTMFEKVLKICDGLDAKKKKFEADLASMEAKRIAAEQKIIALGKSPALKFDAPKLEANRVTDYDAMQRVLDSQQEEWKQQVRSVQRAVDDAAEMQRRSNAAIARQRRQVKELEASRQRNQQSSQYNVGFAVGYVSGGSRQEDDASSYRPSTSTYSAPETPSYSQPDPTPSPSYPDTSTTDTSWSTDSSGSNVSDNSW